MEDVDSRNLIISLLTKQLDINYRLYFLGKPNVTIVWFNFCLFLRSFL